MVMEMKRCFKKWHRKSGQEKKRKIRLPRCVGSKDMKISRKRKLYELQYHEQSNWELRNDHWIYNTEVGHWGLEKGSSGSFMETKHDWYSDGNYESSSAQNACVCIYYFTYNFTGFMDSSSLFMAPLGIHESQKALEIVDCGKWSED